MKALPITTWSPAMRGAAQRGQDARAAGASVGANPYTGVPLSRAFFDAWHDGWRYGK